MSWAEGSLRGSTDLQQIEVVSKYSSLRDRLRTSGRAEVRMSFEELSNLLPGGLPPSAYRYDAWWSNEDGPESTHSQSRLGWMAAGYTAVADRTAHQVVFARIAG